MTYTLEDLRAALYPAADEAGVRLVLLSLEREHRGGGWEVGFATEDGGRRLEVAPGVPLHSLVYAILDYVQNPPPRVTLTARIERVLATTYLDQSHGGEE